MALSVWHRPRSTGFRASGVLTEGSWVVPVKSYP